MTVSVRCNAKINLYLRVLGKRHDGFHDLVSVMQSIGLTDILTVEETDSDSIEITCSNPDVPVDESNLVWKAAKVVAEKSGHSPHGLKFHIEKSIPMMGGLAGGSSNAAGTLVALRDLWKLDFEDGDLVDLAADVGSDVPFCVLGGTTIVRGRGDILEPLTAGIATSRNPGVFIVAAPPIEISTRDAYNELDSAREKAGGEIPEVPDPDAFRNIWMDAILNGTFNMMFMNDFENVVLGMNPWLKEVHTAMRNEVGQALLTGSGAAIFAWLPDMESAQAVIGRYEPVAGEVLITALPCANGIEK